MGDISRHRDIYLNTREAIPIQLLGRCRIARADLTYLEMGNYLTDVSQFRDPVTYIFAKQRVWREKILPRTGDKGTLLRVLSALAAYATAVPLLGAGRTKNAALAATLGVLPSLVSNDRLAGILGLDDWVDRMLGKPIELTPGKRRRRSNAEYGYIGQFFQHFIAGITHLLFAAEVPHKVSGDWGRIERIPERSVTSVLEAFFTQYYPHEHTDQPPFVWDASQRDKAPKWYAPSRRQRDTSGRSGGVMNAVDQHYVQYLAEGLSKIELEWRKTLQSDTEARRRLLVRTGKILHGVEDWYFHSNVVELLRLRGHAPTRAEAEDEETFARRFTREGLRGEAVFAAASRAERARLQRRLYRRLRFPAYERGNRKNTAGSASKQTSTLSLDHAYPAFPSQQDTAHTLLHALENLERKGHGGRGDRTELPPWAFCVLERLVAIRTDVRRLVEQKARARGISAVDVMSALAAPEGPAAQRVKPVIVDVLREWLPLVLTLLHESERQRLVADVDPLQWTDPVGPPPPAPAEPSDPSELDRQVDRHAKALEPKAYPDGVSESNYERAVRLMSDCGFLNPAGQASLRRAFEIDRKSQKESRFAPGAGGFLMQFAIDLQKVLDEGDAATERLNGREAALFDPASDNGSFSEIIGAHSLMSKDTLASSPFFDDAKVLASVASSSVLQMLLEAVSAAEGDSGLDWQKILWQLIRYPLPSGGWERAALALFRKNGKIPRLRELPELTALPRSARLPKAELARWRKGTKADELEEEYIKLELQVSKYRYP